MLKPLIALILLGAVFFGSLILAARFYPQPYAWYKIVMSTLASPRDNPHAYRIACAGLAIAGLLLIPCGATLQKRLDPFSPVLASWAGRFLLIGALFMTFSALVVPGHYRVFGFTRTHEHLAQVSAAGFCLALIFYLDAIFRLPAAFVRLRILGLICVGLPVAAFLLSRCCYLFARQCLPADAYQAVKSSVWIGLALWEWIGAFAIYLFLCLFTFSLPGRDKGPPP
jgi:hypothetical protein